MRFHYNPRAMRWYYWKPRKRWGTNWHPLPWGKRPSDVVRDGLERVLAAAPTVAANTG